MEKRLWIGLLGAAIIILGFQNCGQVKFDSADGRLVAKTGDDGAIDDGDGNALDLVEDDGEDVADDGEEHKDKKHKDKKRGGKKHKKDDKHAADEDCEDDEKGGKKGYAGHEEDDVDAEDGDAGDFVCVLEGAGKSVKAAYVNERLSGKNGTPADICMSRHACETIVSRALRVKGAEKRGFCPGKNPNVVSLSDQQVQALVDKIRLKSAAR